MHFGHKNTATVIQRCMLLLRNSWRLALMVPLFALTCWEVNPGQMPVQEDAPAKSGASAVVAQANGDQVR